VASNSNAGHVGTATTTGATGSACAGVAATSGTAEGARAGVAATDGTAEGARASAGRDGGSVAATTSAVEHTYWDTGTEEERQGEHHRGRQNVRAT
jgi:hypothetical protein